MLSKTLTNNRTRNGFIATNRPDSAQLVDLHVYIIPKSVWKNVQHLAQNAAMDDAISVGFVRVPPDMKLQNLREQIERLCRIENDFPRDFIFLRSVGRCLTRVKQTQENELKVKHYRPPLTYASEIYLLEGRHEDYTYTPADSPAMSSANYLFGNRHQYRLNLDDHGQSSSRFSNYDPRKPLHDETKNLSKPNVYDLTSYLPSSGRRDWTKFTRNDSGESSPRELLKLQEEQERLRRRQAELQRIRRAVEEKKLNSGREKEEEEEKRRRQEKTETERRRLEQQTQAATKIQASFRGFKDRQAYRKGQQNVLKNDSRISSSKTNIFNKESIKNKENIDINDDELSDSQILSLSSSIESTSDVDSNSSRTETRTIKKQDTESTHSNSSSSLSQKTERKIQSNILSDSKTDESNNINDENIRSTTVTKIRHSADEILPLATPDSDDDIHELEKQETETKRRRQLEEDKRKAKELEEQRQRKLTQKHEDPEHLRTRLQELQTSRVDLEKIQSEVIKNLKYMHSRITLRRREARDMWKKKYFQEKKKTSSLEEQSTQLKTELDQINKKILDIMGKESKHSAQIGHLKSAEVGDFILQITRIQQEILDIRHQIDLAKLRLTTDIKLRNQAENESRTLKYELTQAKMNLKHIRNRIGV
ncbi:unnamed protein product [Rotaria sordida]|uniref:Spermatogenesis-associated protein 1 C-terminal domain-containing protein n=1 Tax=Rotaria sordida TaxID=392033 RepID=A0A813PV31_9BILA|nr:unnamed protein product [Rotaria sordida]CAF0781348.1 unnamed protein product [Rotaria sordida]